MKKKSVAVIRCNGSAGLPRSVPQEQSNGQGGADCESIKMSIKASDPEDIPGICAYGCLGGGSCAAACPLKAITLKKNGPAAVDREKCVGCGKCVRICPQQLISLVPPENTIQPFCSGRAPAKETRETCGAGCIGCGICEKVCPAGAVHVEDRHAVIDQALCIACGMCASRCPRGVIHDANGIISMK